VRCLRSYHTCLKRPSSFDPCCSKPRQSLATAYSANSWQPSQGSPLRHKLPLSNAMHSFAPWLPHSCCTLDPWSAIPSRSDPNRASRWWCSVQGGFLQHGLGGSLQSYNRACLHPHLNLSRRKKRRQSFLWVEWNLHLCVCGLDRVEFDFSSLTRTCCVDSSS